jgi:hypothetical protein
MGQAEIDTLLQAAKSNDMNYLTKALDDGADINGTESEVRATQPCSLALARH